MGSLMFKPPLIIRLLCLLILPSAWAQPARDPIKFEKITIDQGLTDNFIRTLLQDHQGFFWIGAISGLSRFDGYQFYNYTLDPREPNSLSNNQIQCLFEDRENRLWIGSMNGLNLYNREMDYFTHYRHNPDDSESLSNDLILAIAQDGEGQLWIGTQAGLNRMNPETGKVTRFYYHPHFPYSLSHNTITALLTDSQGRLWVGTERGLDRYDPETGYFEHYRQEPGSKGSDHVTVLFEDREGILWVGTMGGGMSRLDPETGDFKVYVYDPKAPNQFAYNVSGIAQDQKGNLWITTLKGINLSGLHRFNPKTETFVRYAHDASNPNSLSWNYATAAFIDQSGILWAGTSRGLNKYDPNGRKFKTYRQFPGDSYHMYDNIYGIYMDEDGLIWMGLDMPAFLTFDPKQKRYKLHLGKGFGLENLGGAGAYAVTKDGNGMMWIGLGDEGLWVLNPKTRVKKVYRNDPSDTNSLPSNFLSYILKTKDSTMWVGTDKGLSRFNRETDNFTNFQYDFNDPNSLSSDRVSYIFEDSDGVIWVGTGPTSRDAYVAGARGLNRYQPESQNFRVYQNDQDDPSSISNNWIRVIFEDSSKRLWIGANNGLNLMNREQGTFKYYLKKDGLPGAVVTGILEDDHGRLWLSTYDGLSCFNPETENFLNYDVSDGLQHSRFNQNAFFKAPDGKMIFGGVSGLNIFHPDEIKPDPYQPPVVMTGMDLFNTPVAIGPQSPLKKNIALIEDLVLDYNQNDLTLHFAALHFRKPEKNRYSFYLENYEKDWNQANYRRSAHYTNLDPGNYIFRVKASNKDDVWNEEGLGLKITILPPWWLTWWAFALYVAAFAASVYALIRIQLRRAQFKMAVAAQKEREMANLREAQLARMAAEAQSRAMEADNRRKTEELEKARALQVSMLPPNLPDLPGYAIAAQSLTATEVGGDYYDYCVNDANTLTLAVGDATGHGLQAGIMVAATKSLFNAFSQEQDLREILIRTSRALKLMGLRNMYMGMTLARFTGRKLEIAAAGLPFPILYRAASDSVEELQLRGLPLGSPIEYPYQAITLELEPGDTLLIMSDGLPETFNEDEKMLGKNAVAEAFRKHGRNEPQVIVDALLSFGAQWAGKRAEDDDVTAAVVQIKHRA